MNDSIGEKPASEESSKESESWFRYAIEATSDGLYDMDVVKGTARCNSRYYTMLGYELYELPPTTETWLSLLHPDDRDSAFSKLSEQISQKYEYLENEYRLKHKDGSWVWILDRSKIVEYDQAGKTLRIVGTHIDITEHKKTVEEHRKELLFTAAVIENVADGICVCHNIVDFPYVKFTVWNNRMTEITGYTMDDINRNGWYQTLYPDPELQMRAIERMQSMRQGDDISREEWLITRADNTKRLLNISTTMINSEDGTAHVLGLMQDITERRQAEESLRSAEILYQNLVETSQDLIWQCDSEGRYTYLNPAWENVFGYKLEEMLGRKFSEFQSPLIAERDLQVFASLLQGNPVKNLETVHIGKDGREIILIFNAKFLSDSHGNMTGTCGTAYDITERKNNENKVKSLLAEKELILKEVHHRLKNNMNTVRSLLTLQSISLKDPLAISALQDTISRVEGMVVLYDKLYRSDNFKDISLLVYLPPLIDEILSNFPNSEFVKVEKKIDDFIVDVNMLQPLGIIINELLTNIMKYAFTGRDNNFIAVSATLTGKRVSIIISDNGHGIPESITFENSTGFGMQLVSMLTQQIGGSIRIERERERERERDGSRFILEFDLH